MKRFVIASLALATALAAAPLANACSCLRADSAAQQAETYQLVFIGRVIDTGPARDTRGFWQRVSDMLDNRPAPIRNHITRFQVDEMLKGPHAQNLSVTHLHGDWSATCGVSFPRGEAVLVLASAQTDGGYSTSLCALPQFPEADFRDLFAQ